MKGNEHQAEVRVILKESVENLHECVYVFSFFLQ